MPDHGTISGHGASLTHHELGSVILTEVGKIMFTSYSPEPLNVNLHNKSDFANVVKDFEVGCYVKLSQYFPKDA